MKNLFIAAIFCCILSIASFAKSYRYDFQIDGNLSDNELKNTKEQDLKGGGKIFYKTIGSQLYVGVRGVKTGISHVCVTDGKAIYVFHASAALGRAVFKDTDGRWQLAEKFKWEMRDVNMTPDIETLRKNYFKKNGWLANVVGMGKSTEMEYIISSKFLDGNNFRFAVVYAVDPDSIQYFPQNLTDDSKFVKLISGDPPETLKFDTKTWAISNEIEKTLKTKTSLKREIESQNTKFSELTGKRDFKTAAEIYTESGQLLQPNGKTITGRKDVAEYWKLTFATGINEIKTIISEIQGNDEMLYELGRYEVYLPNRQMVDDGKYIVIWKKVNGKWLRDRDIWNTNRKSR